MTGHLTRLAAGMLAISLLVSPAWAQSTEDSSAQSDLAPDGVTWDWRTTLSSNVAGDAATIPVGFTNSGMSAWQAGGSTPTELSYVWLDAENNVLSWATEHSPLPSDLAPGDTASGLVNVTNPSSAGNYTLRIGLVRDGVWFQTSTDGPLVLDIGVPITPATSADMSVPASPESEAPPPDSQPLPPDSQPLPPESQPAPPASPAANATPPGPTRPAPSLHVSGNRILDAVNQPVTMVGVNHGDTEYLCDYGQQISNDPLDLASVQAKAAWHINVVRIPLSEDCWLGTQALPAATTGANYRNAIVNYVELLNQQGMVAILSDSELTPQNGSGKCCFSLTYMPNEAQTPAFWKSVASTFKGNNAVVFGLFNEPIPGREDTPAAWKCLRDGGKCVGVSSLGPGPAYTVAGMQELVNLVRATGATNLILVPGVGGGNVLSSWLAYKPNDPLNNMGASWHSYLNLQCNTQACWDAQIAPVAAQVPVIAEEIGQADCKHGYIDGLMKWLDARQISYLGWSWWVGDCTRGPALISDYSGTPTDFGIGFRDHLLARTSAR